MVSRGNTTSPITHGLLQPIEKNKTATRSRPSLGLQRSSFHKSSFRKSEPTDDRTVKKATRSVTFQNVKQVRVYKPDDVPNEEIWWRPQEIAVFREADRQEIRGSSDARRYLTVFKQSYKELETTNKVNSDLKREIVTGFSMGYRGLEIFTSIQQKDRRIEIQYNIKSILKLYQKARMIGTVDTSRALRAHATSLTSNHRKWALFLGKVDEETAKNDSLLRV